MIRQIFVTATAVILSVFASRQAESYLNVRIDFEAFAAQTQGGNCVQTYTVAQNDTAFNIASRFGMLLPEIQRLNPNFNMEKLDVGNILCLYIPCLIPPSLPDGRAKAVQVIAGQTCQTVMNANTICLEALQSLNPTVQCSTPFAQTQGMFVSRGFTPNCRKFYTIVSGDFGFAIAQANGLSIDQLQSLNPGLNLTTIFPGNNLCVAV